MVQYYSDISVQGKLDTTDQGIVMGAVTTEPGTTGGLVASECNGITVLYNDTFYHSNGTTWVQTPIGDVNVQADWNAASGDAAILNKPTLGAAAGKGVDTTVPDDSENLPTSKAVAKAIADAIDSIPTPMQFKGTLGTGGTITSLPAASASNDGYTYKAISAGTSPVAYAIGDTLISNGTIWIVIPSGDEPSGTVTNVATGAGLTGGPITTSGTIALDVSGATAGSYGDSTDQTPAYGGKFKVPFVTVDEYGRITAISVHDVTIPAAELGGKTITTTAPASTSDDTTIPTSKAVYSAIKDMGSAVIPFTLTASAWTASGRAYTLVVPVIGVSASRSAMVGLTVNASAEARRQHANSMVMCTGIGNGTVAFTAQSVPTVDIPMAVQVI